MFDDSGAWCHCCLVGVIYYLSDKNEIMKNTFLFTAFILCVFCLGCASDTASGQDEKVENRAAVEEQQPEVVAMNALSEAEQAAGWKLLFDGQTTEGWHTYRKDQIGSSWKVVDSVLLLK